MRKHRILVIDDDADVRDFCRAALEPEGYEVLEAASGAEGLRLTPLLDPDLIVLDVMMEEIDTGFQVAARLLADAPKRPILLLSYIADASAETFDVSTLPVREIVNKPIRPEILCQKVRRLLPSRA